MNFYRGSCQNKWTRMIQLVKINKIVLICLSTKYQTVHL
uniref:Uncharacterized protein n=1 Tax=Arundo donax TaxID=35708 RepID=A0A0A9H2X2_ARUDO